MSLVVVGLIVVVGIVAGLTVTLAEQIRVEVKRRRADLCKEQVQHSVENLTQRVAQPTKSDVSAASFVTPSHEERATAYRNILGTLSDDLERDIAEWEAVLEEFPQVLLAEDNLAIEDQPFSRITEETCQDRLSEAEKTVPLKRSRRVDPEERGQIVRLLNTGFAPEEIALWLNLPLERVQELLNRP